MNDSPGFQRRPAWVITAMLTGLATINFLDKVVFGMVAVPLMAEMQLSPAQFGLIAGSFFWLFSTSTVAVGFLSNRVQTRWILLAMGVSWAVMQVPQALATSAIALLVCRVLLGAAEGPSFPVSIHALYKWFPDQKRNLPVSIIAQGAALGLLLAGLLIPLVTREWGWRANFIILGVVGVIWSLLWLYIGREGNLGAQTGQSGGRGNGAEFVERLPYRTILTDPSVVSTFLLGFAAYWMLGQNLTWLPTYLEKGLGFNSIQAGRWFAVVTEVAAPVNIGLSWLSQRMLQRGASTRQARAQFVCLMMITGAALFLLLPLLHLSPVQRVILLTIAGALPTLCFTLAPALLAEVVPSSQRGAIVAINTAVASLGAAISPVVMGRIVQMRGSVGEQAYELGFVTGAALLIATALIGLRWLHPEHSNRALKRSTPAVTA
ncbi:MFS transporter [Caballeronia novacaledonica]|uniref:MFS transporter n=1 Tax=Caballeronia novacaledonica TaxID=1544861 RepID=A0A2U3I0Z5_9BURK|nr:MFS transporter [Caballeronia novacaledonica]SPB13768.1 MFS transporter [Caballeronia novacaledonica]